MLYACSVLGRFGWTLSPRRKKLHSKPSRMACRGLMVDDLAESGDQWRPCLPLITGAILVKSTGW